MASDEIFLIDPDDLPFPFEYPKELLEHIASSEEPDVEPWVFARPVAAWVILSDFERIRDEQPQLGNLVPFSKMECSTNTACFKAGLPGEPMEVLTVELDAAKGCAYAKRFPSFGSWLEYVIENWGDIED